MNYPKYVIIDDEKYEINTDFRIAIECNEIAEDSTIGDYERALAIIYKLFGDKALENKKNYKQLMKYALKYLQCGKEQVKRKNNKKPDMDLIEDMDYIEASFQSDYNITLENTQMHFWKFMKLLEGLSNSELGNCCILNRVRNFRNLDPKKIKNSKERNEVIEIQKEIALKKYQENQGPTQEQKEKADELYKKLGLRRE